MCLKLLFIKARAALTKASTIIQIPPKSLNDFASETMDCLPEKSNEKQTQSTKTTKMKLSDESRGILRNQLKVDEGCVLHVYKDSMGYETIGYGRCLDTKGLSKAECDYLKINSSDYFETLKTRGITQIEADYLLSNDIDDFSEELHNRIGWFDRLPETAKIVLINMAFNLGIGGLMDFRKTLLAIKYGDYKQASIEMLDSSWSKQVGQRAIRLSKLLAELS